MPEPSRRPAPAVVAVSLGAVAVVLAVVAYVVVKLLVPDTGLQQAVRLLPPGTLRVSYTDWPEVVAEAKGSGITASSKDRAIEDFLGRAYDKDLTASSSLVDSFTALGRAYGVTPADAEWEVYGQSRDGSVAILKLKDGVSLDDLRSAIAGLGYQTPTGGASSDGTWVGTPEIVAAQSPILTPQQQNLAVIGDERLFVMSDQPEYVDTAVSTITGSADDLSSVSGVSDLVDIAGTPVEAEMWTRDFACEDLAMSQADASDQDTAAALTAEAGGVHPLDGLVMAQQPSGSLTLGMAFADEDQASADLQPRTDLASGAAPGQGGSFAERFEVTDSTADGRSITMTLEPREDRVLSDIAQGPVLFATC